MNDLEKIAIALDGWLTDEEIEDVKNNMGTIELTFDQNGDVQILHFDF